MTKLIQTGQIKQTLSITANMQQSINILQMSNYELEQFASEELNKNPFLEEENNSSTPKPKDAQIYSSSRGAGRKDFSDDIFANITSNKTLKDHVEEQINISIENRFDKLIAYSLLDSLQSNGYIDFDEQEIAQNLKCPLPKIKAVLKKMQSFEPAGIFARNLRECLSLQLKELNKFSPKMALLIKNLDLVSKREFKKLAKICHVELASLQKMIDLLKTLNPKPGNGFLVEPTIYKLPDVILYIDQNTNLAKLEINPESMPNLRLNHEYYLQIKNNIRKKEDKIFVNNEVGIANNIIKGIDMRAKTILRVSSCIVEKQMDFFTRGIMYLKPLTLVNIAEMTGLNESTISRATANKYISTPSGIFELKYFFSSGLSSSKNADVDVSSTKVKELIKQIITAEDSNNILSDQEIAKKIEKFNVKIARRTVAKYREEAGIPTSSFRKREQFSKLK